MGSSSEEEDSALAADRERLAALKQSLLEKKRQAAEVLEEAHAHPLTERRVHERSTLCVLLPPRLSCSLSHGGA